MEHPSITVLMYMPGIVGKPDYDTVLEAFVLAAADPMYISLDLVSLEENLHCTDKQLREFMGFIIGSQLRDGKSVLVGVYDNWIKKQQIDFVQEIKIIAAQYKVSVRVLEGEEVLNFAKNVKEIYA